MATLLVKLHVARHLWCGLSAIAACAAHAQVLKAERPIAKVQAAATPGALASLQASGGPMSAVVTWTLNPAVLTLPAGPVLGTATPLLKKSAPAPASAAGTPIVERLVAGAAPVRLALAPDAPNKAVDPGPLKPGSPVTYRVTVTDAKGAPSVKEIAYTPPLPRDPTGLAATVSTDGKVTLSWQPVDGSVGYQISGTALPVPARVTYATQWTSPTPVVAGPQQWKVASVYEPGGVLTAATAWPAVQTRTIPRPQALFLSQPAGGNTATAEQHLKTRCISPFAPLEACPLEPFITATTNWADAWARESITDKDPSDYRAVVPNWAVATVVDTLDLGVGRRVSCAPPRGGKTVCWASSHLDRTWGARFDYSSTAQPSAAPSTSPWSRGLPSVTSLYEDAARFRNVLSMSVIVLEGDKAFFGHWSGISPTKNWSALDGEHIFVTGKRPSYDTPSPPQLHTAAQLDTQGRKELPHVCMSCHGGRYDPVTRAVIGASLLPLLPHRLQRADAQAARRINDIVLASSPAPAIANQIQQWNASQGEVPVPPGWAQQAGLYRQVIEPYCVTCHFAQRGTLSFESFGQLYAARDAVQRAVCSRFTMPHSEILFRKFWSEGGIVSLPGMLSASLGFSRCPE
jgi:hypothetical protein